MGATLQHRGFVGIAGVGKWEAVRNTFLGVRRHSITLSFLAFKMIHVWLVVRGLSGYFFAHTIQTAQCLSVAGKNSEFTTGKLDHLPRCDLEQSRHSLAELAKMYAPTKFTFSHAQYQRFYPRWFEEYRYRKFRMLEIGIDTGSGSLLWKEYFPCVELFGLDSNSETRDTDGGRAIHMFIGSQEDRHFLRNVVSNESGGRYDIILDDGGHHFEMQSTSYTILFEAALKPGGIYVVEDIETSFWGVGELLYGKRITRGGCKDRTTFHEKMLDLTRVVNRKFIDNDFTVFGRVDQWVATITFGSNIVIIEKKDADDCPSETTYTWPTKLSTDCPAREQRSLSRQNFQLARYCKQKQKKMPNAYHRA